MPFTPNVPVDLALKERIRVAYYDDSRPIAAVEEVAGVGRSTLYRWFHAWGWPLRKPMRSRAGGRKKPPAFVKSPASDSVRPAFAPGGPEAEAQPWRTAAREPLKLRLKRLVEHRIALLEHEAMAGIAVDPDANARAIDLNARTLVTIERLAGDPAPCPNCGDGGRPTRTLSQLRDELLGHLDRLRREGMTPEELAEEDAAEEEAARAGGAMSAASDDPAHGEARRA